MDPAPTPTWIPTEVEAPSSFETVGHLAHLNLRPEHEPFKHRIAQIIMDKSPHVKTVVNKTGDITNTFRTFPMEVLCGEPDFNVEVKTHGLAFRFNYAQFDFSILSIIIFFHIFRRLSQCAAASAFLLAYSSSAKCAQTIIFFGATSRTC